MKEIKPAWIFFGLRISLLLRSLANLDHLPTPDELVADIIEDLQNALESVWELQVYLKKQKKGL